jgi:hypothetical protein
VQDYTDDQYQQYHPYDHLSDDLVIFDKESLLMVEKAAAGLTPLETLALFNVSTQQLDEAPSDKSIFEAAFARGESMGKLAAITSLFEQMNGRQGVGAAVMFLKTKAELWSQVDEASSGNKAFSFTVMMDD